MSEIKTRSRIAPRLASSPGSPIRRRCRRRRAENTRAAKSFSEVVTVPTGWIDITRENVEVVSRRFSIKISPYCGDEEDFLLLPSFLNSTLSPRPTRVPLRWVSFAYISNIALFSPPPARSRLSATRFSLAFPFLFERVGGSPREWSEGTMTLSRKRQSLGTRVTSLRGWLECYKCADFFTADESVPAEMFPWEYHRPAHV